MRDFWIQIAVGFVIIHLGLLMAFIMLNWIVECQSWTDGSCVTPAQYYKMWFGL